MLLKKISAYPQELWISLCMGLCIDLSKAHGCVPLLGLVKL
jgi:hypothetical protein